MAGGDVLDIEAVPGGIREAKLTLKPSLFFKGTVVDESGKAIPRVEIGANANTAFASRAVWKERWSNPDGSFELFNYSADKFTLRGAVA